MKAAIVLPETTNGKTVSEVIANCYAPDLDDIELEKIGRDPFLIAAALQTAGRVVVTREVSSPRKKRANRKVPDACTISGVPSIDDFELWRRLDFRIS